MKIIMRTTAAGPKGVLKADGVYGVPGEVSEADAKAFIAGGYARQAPEAASAAKAPAPAAKAAPAKDYVPAPEPEAEKEKPGKNKK